MRKLLIFLLRKLGAMKNKEILKANNELLNAIAESLNIETEVIEASRVSIGGGGIKKPKKDPVV